MIPQRGDSRVLVGYQILEYEHRVIARVQEVIANAPKLAGKPEITFPDRTYAYSCRKIA